LLYTLKPVNAWRPNETKKSIPKTTDNALL
jgi:hypothetical protein